MRLNKSASVAELVDAPDSKSGALKSVSVRVRPLAPNPNLETTSSKYKKTRESGFFYFCFFKLIVTSYDVFLFL
jgi:hypothetical protein